MVKAFGLAAVETLAPAVSAQAMVGEVRQWLGLPGERAAAA